MLDKSIVKERESLVKLNRNLNKKQLSYSSENKASNNLYNIKSLLPISIILLLFILSLFLPMTLAGFDGSVKFWNASFALNETGVWNITLDAVVPWAFSVHTDTNRTINVTTPADVRKLEITDNGLSYDRMSLTPVQNARANASIRVAIYDLDGPTNQNVTAYICDTSDYAACSDTSYTYAQNLSYLEPAAGANEYYYTYNGTDNMPQFWKQNGTWKLYVKVIDGASTDYNETDFEYVGLLAANYSSILTLGGGTATLGQWNNGTDNYIITNWGNVILSMTWNASDMSSGEDTWNLNGTDFTIDDDSNYADDANNLTFVYLNATQKTFEHSSGLLRCSSDSCTNENSTLNTHYHIAPPLGLKAGTYNTTITITLSKKT